MALYKNRRRRYRKKRIFFAILALILVVAMGLSVFSVLEGLKTKPANTSASESSSSQSSSSEEDSSSAPEPTSVRVMAVGDNLIHSKIYTQAQENAGGKGYDFSYTYKQVAPILAKADFSVMNQETPLVASKPPSNFPLFNTPTELGDYMVTLGFKVFNHANNHILDQGVSGALETIQFWKAKASQGVVLTGAYDGDADQAEVKTQTVNGITFSYIGVTEYTNGNTMPQGSELKLYNLADPYKTRAQVEAEIQAAITKAKAASDVVCIFMHWQQECNTTPTDGQRSLMQKMVSWGVDVIYGSGPHVLQPIEYMDKPDGGKALVVYSLGNFVCTEQKATNMCGGILDLTYTKDQQTKKVSITSANFIPTIIHYNSSYRDIRIIPFSEYTPELAAAHGVNKFESFSYNFAKNVFNTIISSEFMKPLT